MGQASSPCTVTDHAEYTKKIKEFTTEPFFSTELVDHLPLSSCVPPPDAFLHHIVGAPDVLDYTKDINDYMRLLASKSPRVKVWSIGMSEEGREMLVVAVSDEANLAKLDRYKEITRRLGDPRGLSEADAQKLIAEGKPIYWADGSIHSPETGAPEMLMELAYRLAVEETPFIEKIRKDAIVLITPIVEVDGHDRMVDIYLQHKKHPDQPPYPLVWWGHYVAHDNNRDNLGVSLALSRNMLRTFLDWHPTVMHDLHESVPYLYIMTGTGPYNAWLDPIVISEWQEMAYHEIEEMTKRGVIGVWTHGFYDGWAPNYLLSIANNHNSIGRFYETFGNGGADTRVRTLRPPDTSREWYRPNPPLAKVKWSARNNINMQQSAILFGMNNVAANGAKFLNNFYLKSKRAVDKARMEGPAAWAFPADDARPAEQASFLNMLQVQGVEVHRTEKENPRACRGQWT
ncbi:MAG: M14 family zinc carboxypeptidase [Terriglobales bacterium]